MVVASLVAGHRLQDAGASVVVALRRYSMSSVAVAYRLPRWHSGRFDPWVRKIPWSRKWQPTPIFLSEKFYGQRSLVGCSPWGHKELDTTEPLNTHTLLQLRLR